jgi:hypothetical protein
VQIVVLLDDNGVGEIAHDVRRKVGNANKAALKGYGQFSKLNQNA